MTTYRTNGVIADHHADMIELAATGFGTRTIASEIHTTIRVGDSTINIPAKLGAVGGIVAIEIATV